MNFPTIRLVIPALVALLVGGCAAGAEKGIINSWLGSDINEVVSQWGPPQGEREILGKKYFVWGHSQSFNLPAQTHGTATVIGSSVYYSGTTYGGGTVGGSCTRSLEVDDKNIVVAGYSQGNNCCVLALSGYCGSLPKIVK